jgi:hypothetical protein
VRLWSLHPGYLDAKGLTAVWREALLAREVLRGKTRGYRQHPQLERFRAQPHPLAAIEYYLRGIYQESTLRGYRFDGRKLRARLRCSRMHVTQGQLSFERKHLARKLKSRDPARWRALLRLDKPKAHPLFRPVPGGIEPWERAARRTGRRP